MQFDTSWVIIFTHLPSKRVVSVLILYNFTQIQKYLTLALLVLLVTNMMSDLNHHPHTQSTIFLPLFFSLSIWKLNCGLKGADIGWQLCSTWRFFNGKLQLVFPSNERETRSDETSGKKKQVFETVHHPRLFTVKKKLGKVNCANLTLDWYKRGKIGKLEVENFFF